MMIAFIIVMAFLGAPLFAAFGCLALQAYASVDLDASVITSELSRLATMPLLQTLPMFALAGYVLAHSKASDRLVRVSRALFGWMPGGLAIVCLVACTLFTAFTGATGVTIVALGGLLLPALLSERYKERFALGLVTNGGNVGVLFVPSLPLILYGVIANPIAREVTIDRLFLAGILPGLLSVGALAVFSAAYGLGARVPRTKFSLREVGAALWAARWEVPLPFVVIGGIYAGKLVVSEAAVITAAYAIIVEVFFYREIRIRDLGGIVKESMVLVGGILIILGMGMALTNYLIDAEVPMKILEFTQAHVNSRFVFLIVLNLLLLVVGCIMDIYTAIIVVVPLILPMAVEFGVDPIHLGIIFLANLAIGYCTPPVGVNLFVASLRFNKPIVSLYKASAAFLGIQLVTLLIITYLPVISLWLAGR